MTSYSLSVVLSSQIREHIAENAQIREGRYGGHHILRILHRIVAVRIAEVLHAMLECTGHVLLEAGRRPDRVLLTVSRTFGHVLSVVAHVHRRRARVLTGGATCLRTQIVSLDVAAAIGRICTVELHATAATSRPSRVARRRQIRWFGRVGFFAFASHREVLDDA